MTDSAKNRKKFCVVQFIDFPYKGIDDYVCVPDKWIVVHTKRDQIVVVAYPQDEDRFLTRGRVIREEKYNDEWKFWVAKLKYQSDRFEDADFWVATKNDYGPLVPRNSSLNDTPSASTLNKKLRSSKQKSTSKSNKDTSEMTQKPYQITQKPSPRITLKRPSSDESKSQLETKHSKQSSTKTAEPTGAGSQSANGEPGCSSISTSIEDGPLVININEDLYTQLNQQSSGNNNNSQKHLAIDTAATQNNLLDNGNSSSNFKPQITSVQSLASTSNNREPRADDSSNAGPSTSEYEPESIAAELYKKMEEKESLMEKHRAVEMKIRLENITKTVATFFKNPSNSMNQNQPCQELRNRPTRDSQFINSENTPVSSQETQHVARINIERTHNTIENPSDIFGNVASVVSAPLNLPNLPQQHPTFARQLDGQQNSLAQNQHVQQTVRGHYLLDRLHEAQRQDPRLRSEYRPNNAAINTEHLPSGRSVPVSNQLNRIDRPPQILCASRQIQRLLHQRTEHERRIANRKNPDPSSLPNNRISTPLLEETTENTPSLLFSNLPDSIQRELLITRSNFLSHEEELAGALAQGIPIIETRSDIMTNSGISVQANLYQSPRRQMVDRSNERNQVYFQDNIDRLPSSSDSEIGMDHGGISDNQIPAEESFVETTSNINHSQDSSRFVSQQQIKDKFASTSAQMGSTLRYMVNVFENLRTSVLEVAASYQTLLEDMERFNTPENQASQPSASRSAAQEVPLVAEEREIAETGSSNFNGNQNRSNNVNEAPERNPNPRYRLILPPEYDPNDTRWTLKYHEYMPGLVELMPHTNVYVNYKELKYIEESSTSCASLARRILSEVFSKEALSVCSSMTEKGPDRSIYPDERPKLNEHGCLVLLNYILEHGLQRGWKTDMQPILKNLHDKVKEIRFRFGVLSRC